MSKNNFIEGMKFALGFFFIAGILAVFSIYAAGWHTAGEILGGTFLGNYIFNGTVDYKGDVTAGNIFLENLVADNITISPAKNEIIYFNSSMTAQDIQNIIDNVSKFIPYGRTVTFQFLDGTYNLNQTLYFSGFYGGGPLWVKGNRTETDADLLHTTQKVFLDFSSNNGDGLYFNNNAVPVYVYNFKIKVDTSTIWSSAIKSVVNSNYIIFRYSYFIGTSTTYGRGVTHSSSGAIGYIGSNYVSNVARGIECSLADCYSRNNDDIGTMPVYGLYGQSSATIGKYLNQPTGSTADEYVRTGALIRS